MDARALKEHMTEQLTFARDSYLNDLSALEEPVLGKSLGGVARSAYDFTYEVVFVNKRIITRLKGGVPEKFDSEGWVMAPAEFRDKATAMAAIRETMNDVIQAWNAVPEEEIDRKIEVPNGETSPFKLVDLCVTHASYHDAQLNFIQALTGDEDMHWE